MTGRYPAPASCVHSDSLGPVLDRHSTLELGFRCVAEGGRAPLAVPATTRGDQMVSIRWLAIGAGVACFSAGVAIAASQPAETTAVTADFQAGVVFQSQRQCDVDHVKFRVKFEGTQTSADARL